LTDSSKIAPKWLSIENDEITWTNAPQEVQTFNIFLIVSAQTTSAYSHDVMISVVTI
jgi:hypothetical protein